MPCFPRSLTCTRARRSASRFSDTKAACVENHVMFGPAFMSMATSTTSTSHCCCFAACRLSIAKLTVVCDCSCRWSGDDHEEFIFSQAGKYGVGVCPTLPPVSGSPTSVDPALTSGSGVYVQSMYDRCSCGRISPHHDATPHRLRGLLCCRPSETFNVLLLVVSSLAGGKDNSDVAAGGGGRAYRGGRHRTRDKGTLRKSSKQ